MRITNWTQAIEDLGMFGIKETQIYLVYGHQMFQ
jgi:hypothetical protein